MFVLLSITSIFSFLFNILLVATSILDGSKFLLLSYIYCLVGFTALLLLFNYFDYNYNTTFFGWFYFAFILFSTYITAVLPPSSLVSFPLYGIRAILFWAVIVWLCSLSLCLCLPETLIILCCVPFVPSLAPPLLWKWIPRIEQ